MDPRKHDFRTLVCAGAQRCGLRLYLDGLGREAHLPAFENLLRSNLEATGMGCSNHGHVSFLREIRGVSIDMKRFMGWVTPCIS